MIRFIQASKSRLRKQAGPSSLNICQRRNIISKINQENDEFVKKLETIKPTVPNKKTIEKNQEKVKYFLN